MSKDEKTALVPKLRFPEFISVKGWDEKNLGCVTYSVSRKNSNGEKYPIYSINNKEGFLPQADQFEGVDSNSRGYDISLYKIVDKNTFAYNPARINVGSIGYSGELCDIIISSLYVCFKTNEEIDDGFFQHFLSTSSFNRQVENNTEGGIRSYLFYENFSKILLAFPDIEEQRKIADCLSSLDDLITAEDKKLEALKMHKKVLMQKLFPADVKTVPEWRFPEFRDSGEWNIYLIKDFAKVTTGNKDTQNKVDNGKYPFFVRSQAVEKIDSYAFDCEAILTSGDGVGVGKNFHYIVGKFDFHQRVYCIYDFPKTISGKFVFQYFSEHFNKRVMQLSAKNSVDSVRMSMITEMPIAMPSKEEQQKIADCLSSLDDLITAQAEKIKALKLHKKGLMQGLFPSVVVSNSS